MHPGLKLLDDSNSSARTRDRMAEHVSRESDPRKCRVALGSTCITKRLCVIKVENACPVDSMNSPPEM